MHLLMTDAQELDVHVQTELMNFLKGQTCKTRTSQVDMCHALSSSSLRLLQPLWLCRKPQRSDFKPILLHCELKVHLWQVQAFMPHGAGNAIAGVNLYCANWFCVSACCVVLQASIPEGLGNVSAYGKLISAYSNEMQMISAAQSIAGYLQASILEEEAMPALVKVLDGGPVSAGTIASVWALMEICMKNPAGQQELLKHEGLAKVRP